MGSKLAGGKQNRLPISQWVEEFVDYLVWRWAEGHIKRGQVREEEAERQKKGDMRMVGKWEYRAVR